ncbi:Piso0_004519 [Millerozyma farinosa CBS 7064]|uniref:RNA helicase n=1 Tax=Pichia sorbitophila (strain ATCC MYA-4447 / BCRC 22081 / CBS 7064 / NBRC 10061 / NRRL Y-12695) TaxID=559304 RepID=G8Y908_PICSO|nr:Piso0_004519 [Millerozyma farinosa CBS 7064]CCE84953.1 Piso0_004519 [Millerozyma farinosa CBS 7064]
MDKKNKVKKHTSPKKTNGKFKKSFKGVKKAIPLKKKLQKGSKIVKADNLKWKEVEIPDNLDDYEGFYGLEELDGVDVEYENGNIKFIVKDGDKVEEKEKKTGDEVTKTEVSATDNDDEDASDFGGFSDDEMDVDGSDSTDVAPIKEAKAKEVSEDSELTANTFTNLSVTLPDPNSIDLPHWKPLSLSAYTLQGLQQLKFSKPTPIQKKAIPYALEGRDTVGKAVTGSGKTLAYGIPILERYLTRLQQAQTHSKTSKISSPAGIIFAPTRELAHQVVDHLKELAKYFPFPPNAIVSMTGGLSIQKQERLLEKGPGIVVTTPGRFLEILQSDEKYVTQLSGCDIVVLDEADRLLQDGHFEEFEKALELLSKSRKNSKAKSWRWQTLVYSATFSKDLFSKLDKNPRRKETFDSSKSLVDNTEIITLLNSKLKFRDSAPALVDANPKEIVAGQITEALVECGSTERDLYLYYFLLLYSGTTLVFANSIDSVKRLSHFLKNLNIPTFSLHSSMIQKQRLRALEKFKEASTTHETCVLIASDVAARGLDIPNINHVAHYHLPRSADVYIHRSGRTARVGNEGVSVMFCSPQEASGSLRKLRNLVSANASASMKFNTHADVKLLPIDMDILSQIRKPVKIAASLADSEVATTSTKKEDSWLKKAAEELDVEYSSDMDDFQDEKTKKSRMKKDKKSLSNEEAKRLRFELKELLNRKIRKNHRRSYLTSGLHNLAHDIVTNKTHENIYGHEKVTALEKLK